MSLILDGDGSISGIDEGIHISGVSTITGDIHITGAIDHVGDEDTRIQFPADNTFSIDTAGSERLRITSAGNVGINSDSPASRLDVQATDGNGLLVAAPILPDISLKRNGSTSATGNIDWIGNTNVVGARIGVNDDVAGSMQFKLGGTGASSDTRMIITSAGNVGIGTDSPQAKLHVKGDNTAARGQLCVAGNSSADARITLYRDNGTFNGSLQAEDGNLTLALENNIDFNINAGNQDRFTVSSGGTCFAYAGGSNNTGKTSGQEAFRVGNGGGNFRFSVYPDGSTVIGGTGLIDNNNLLLRNDGVIVPTAGAGVSFGEQAGNTVGSATTTSSLLDNYEEGTWIPSLGTSGTQPTSVVYSTRVGSYTRIGRLVYITCGIQPNSVNGSPTGDIRITGLPFTSANDGDRSFGNGVSHTNGTFSWGADKTSLVFNVSANTSTIRPFAMENGVAEVGIDISNFTSSAKYLFISLCYFV